MKAEVGDRIVVEAEKVGQPTRTGVVEEVLAPDPPGSASAGRTGIPPCSPRPRAPPPSSPASTNKQHDRRGDRDGWSGMVAPARPARPRACILRRDRPHTSFALPSTGGSRCSSGARMPAQPPPGRQRSEHSPPRSAACSADFSSGANAKPPEHKPTPTAAAPGRPTRRPAELRATAAGTRAFTRAAAKRTRQGQPDPQPTRAPEARTRGRPHQADTRPSRPATLRGERKDTRTTARRPRNRPRQGRPRTHPLPHRRRQNTRRPQQPPTRRTQRPAPPPLTPTLRHAAEPHRAARKQNRVNAPHRSGRKGVGSRYGQPHRKDPQVVGDREEALTALTP
jgi:Domain of unknown function (DUF1918)